MENFATANLTVIAGRPGAGKTAALNKLIKEAAPAECFVISAQNPRGFFKTLQKAADGGCKILAVEDIPSAKKRPMRRSLKKLKLFAMSRDIAALATVMLGRKYLKEGSLDHAAVRADLRGVADRLIVVECPPYAQKSRTYLQI